MDDADRAQDLAACAAALARRAGVSLPRHLGLWRLAGGRQPPMGDTGGEPGLTGVEAAWLLVDAVEERLGYAERRRGAHYTPRSLADRVVRAAGRRPDDGEPVEECSGKPVWMSTGSGGGGRPTVATVADPSCGGGSMLLAAARHLAEVGIERDEVARDLLFGADVDPLAVAVAEAAITLWSGGTPPACGHLVVADSLLAGRSAWPRGPARGFDRVVGNPPFQGQLTRDTARDEHTRGALRDRFGPAAAGYADTAALFLLAAVDMAAPGGTVALVQPQSTVAARDAGPVRADLARRARLVDLVVPEGRSFRANVHTCVPVLEVPGDGGAGNGAGLDCAGDDPEAAHRTGPADTGRGSEWAVLLATARGVPSVDLPRSSGVVGDVAEVIGGFRRHYYGLVGHVREAPDGDATEFTPLVTSGLIDLGGCAWGRRSARFARQVWDRPVVDLASVRAAHPELGGWLDSILRPKVLVASQTKVVEAVADGDGRWVPSTPVVSVVPRASVDVDRLAAVLCSPPAAAWAATTAVGTGLSPGAIRVSAALAREIPLPADGDAWAEASESLAAGDLDRFAKAATAMYALPVARAASVTSWWTTARQ